MIDRDVLERLALLAGRSWRADPMGGGLNNAACRVRSEGLDLVVRRWEAGDGLDHDVEATAAAAAAAVGAGPAVLAYEPELRVIAIEYADGVDLEPEDLQDDAVLARVVATLRRLHTATAPVPPLDLLTLVDVPPATAEALSRDREPLVLCHNDLVPANLIDDGQRVALIDFEYAGLGEPSQELAGLAVGAGLDAERLVELYDGAPSPRRVERVRQWQVVVRRLWSDWARTHGHPQWIVDDHEVLDG